MDAAEKVVLQLAGVLSQAVFAFVNAEVPEHIGFGGTQKLAVHELPGGGRVVDVLGAQPRDLQWSGWFVGEQALARARALDAMRARGEALWVGWAGLSFQAVISSFEAEFHRCYQIPYSISLTVAEDRNQSELRAVPQPVDASVAEDMANFPELVRKAAGPVAVDDVAAKVQGFAGTFTQVTGGVSSLAALSSGALARVLTPLHEARQAVLMAMGLVENLLENAASLGGLVPNNAVAGRVAALNRSMNLLSQQEALVRLDGTLGRVQGNLQAAPASGSTVVVNGANLFALAESHYGDATGWSTIARANGLADPQVLGPGRLVIPAQLDV